MARLTFRYYAAARAAAGVSTETVEAASVHEGLAEVCGRHDDRFTLVVKASSLLLDGIRVDDQHLPQDSDAEIHVLPPFAGG